MMHKDLIVKLPRGGVVPSSCWHEGRHLFWYMQTKFKQISKKIGRSFLISLFSREPGCWMPDIFPFLWVWFLQRTYLIVGQLGTIPLTESKCISLPFSEVPERMPLKVVVATDHITLRIVFYLEHHIVPWFEWGGLPPLGDYSTMKDLFIAVV